MVVFVVRCEQASQPSIAPQPLGFTAGVKGCEERVEQLRRSSSVDERQVLVAVENFIVEILPDRYRTSQYNCGTCALLQCGSNFLNLDRINVNNHTYCFLQGYITCVWKLRCHFVIFTGLSAQR